MSSAHAAHADDAASHAQDHDFDGEPAHTLPADEPRTPAWIPALGLSLFAAAAVAMLITTDADAARPKPPEAPVQIEPVAPPTPQRAVPAAQGTPTPRASGSARQVSPQQLEELRKRMEEARARGQFPAGSAAPKAGGPTTRPRPRR